MLGLLQWIVKNPWQETWKHMSFISHAIAQKKNTSKQSKSTNIVRLVFATHHVDQQHHWQWSDGWYPTRMDGVHTGANQSVIQCGDTKFVFRYLGFRLPSHENAMSRLFGKQFSCGLLQLQTASYCKTRAAQGRTAFKCTPFRPKKKTYACLGS